MGDLGCEIVGQTLRNLRNGDSFWFENIFSQAMIDEISSTTLSDIIRRNTNAK